MRIATIVFGFMIIGFGLILRLNAGQSLDYIESQTRWPKAKATVTAQDVWVSKDPRGGGAYYYPAFKFDYMIDDEPFKGTTKFGEAYEERDQALAVARESKFKNGSTVDIHYNPTKPEITAYEPEKELPFLRKLMSLGKYLVLAGILVSSIGIVLILTKRLRGNQS
ncbi:MAG: DUF3592 domain-containing protein [Planctomycetota bacterium]|nr:DUF3592 domain-containing protein [Planctomycetota bacterium]MDP7251331.1 DUF3592 domain-containing protein [Planctomycetota bacterium]